MPDESPEPRRGVMPRQQVPGPAASAVGESSGQYVARRAVHVPDGGLFALLNGSGVLDRVRNGLPYTMFDELAGAVGGSQRELAAVIGIPATTLARRKFARNAEQLMSGEGARRYGCASWSRC